MAVRDRAWTRGEGIHPRPPGHAAMVVARYGLMNVFESRVFLAFYVLCLMPSISALIAIYMSHSSVVLEQIPGVQDWAAKVPGWLFPRLFGWQAFPAFLVGVIAAPPLIAADLSHNAITLILSRPITRSEYVLGKTAVLLAVLSPLTWMPGVGACLLEGLLDRGPWLMNNLRIPLAYLVAHCVWIIVISLFGLAISSRVRYAALARGVMLAVILIGSGTGAILSQLTRSPVGDLLRLPKAIEAVFATMVGVQSPSGLPSVLNWASLLGLAAVSLWMLNRKLRACEDLA